MFLLVCQCVKKRVGSWEIEGIGVRASCVCVCVCCVLCFVSCVRALALARALGDPKCKKKKSNESGRCLMMACTHFSTQAQTHDSDRLVFLIHRGLFFFERRFLLKQARVQMAPFFVLPST